jgi:hypothetical protein
MWRLNRQCSSPFHRLCTASMAWTEIERIRKDQTAFATLPAGCLLRLEGECL